MLSLLQVALEPDSLTTSLPVQRSPRSSNYRRARNDDLKDKYRLTHVPTWYNFRKDANTKVPVEDGELQQSDHRKSAAENLHAMLAPT